MPHGRNGGPHRVCQLNLLDNPSPGKYILFEIVTLLTLARYFINFPRQRILLIRPKY
jgi:hypothetical protein